MERSVVLRSGYGPVPVARVSAKNRERDREPRRSRSVPAPVEMRLQKLSNRRRFERRLGSSRRG
jgi:hypothetical protein